VHVDNKDVSFVISTRLAGYFQRFQCAFHLIAAWRGMTNGRRAKGKINKSEDPRYARELSSSASSLSSHVRGVAENVRATEFIVLQDGVP